MVTRLAPSLENASADECEVRAGVQVGFRRRGCHRGARSTLVSRLAAQHFLPTNPCHAISWAQSIADPALRRESVWAVLAASEIIGSKLMVGGVNQGLQRLGLAVGRWF